MKNLHSILLAVCLATLATSVGSAAYPVKEDDCDDNEQRTVTDEFLRKTSNAGYRDNIHDSANFVSDNGQKLREHYEKLKDKADKFVSTSGVRIHDLGTNLGESFNNFESTAGSHVSGSSKAHLSGGIRPPVPFNFYNNEGSLVDTVEGLKAHAHGVQYTPTGGMLPLKNYQAPETSGGYGSTYEKHSSSSSQQTSNVNTGLPQATITYTPNGWEKHHQSSSVNVEEKIKRRNFTDYLQPEIIRQQEKIVVQPLNYAYGEQVGSNTYGGSASHSQSSFDRNNQASYGTYQVPMTVIPVLGGNDANYSSEAKSQSMSQSKYVSSYDSAHGGSAVKPVKFQTGLYIGTTPAGVGDLWHKLVQGQTGSRFISSNPSAVLETSFGTTKSESEDDSFAHVSPITLTVPQSQISQQSSHQQSSSASSRYESSHSSSGSSSKDQSLNFQGQGSNIQGQGLNVQSQGQIKGSSVSHIPTNTFVGNPKAPQNSGYAITGENKGFYAKSVELANLLSPFAPFGSTPDENQNQKVESDVAGINVGSEQVHLSGSEASHQQRSSSTTGLFNNERKPVLVTGGYGLNGGYQNSYEKHESSSSQHKQTQGSNQGGQIFGSQDSFSGVPVINEPYRLSARYTGGSAGERVYDWSSSGSGYGQYNQQRVRPLGGYVAGGAYGGDSRSSSSYQSHSSSSGSQGASLGRLGGSDVACRECSEGQIQYTNGNPVKQTYGLSSQFAASASNINGKQSETKSASVTINDNGKVDSYSRHS